LGLFSRYSVGNSLWSVKSIPPKKTRQHPVQTATEVKNDIGSPKPIKLFDSYGLNLEA